MKTTFELAQMLNVSVERINSTIRQHEIASVIEKHKRYLNTHQIDLIQLILIFEGKLDSYVF